MHDIQIIEATLDHVHKMGVVMNDEDRIESEAVGVKAHRALWRGYKNSVIRRTALVDGEVAAIWGVIGGLMSDRGVVWLVTGRKVREISPYTFVRIYRAEVVNMLEYFPILCNYVIDDYQGAKRMLKLAGFHLGEAAPLGKFQRLYRKFYKEA